MFHIFLNDLLAVLKKSQLYNFADDNTISAEASSTNDLLKILKEDSESAVKWFRQKNTIVNPDKLQAIVLQKGNKNNNTNNTLNIENITINPSKSVKLLGITIDNKWSFEGLISVLWQKASLQLNAISHLQKYMGKKEKGATISVSSILTSTTAPLFGILVRVNPQVKLSKYKNVVLELY